MQYLLIGKSESLTSVSKIIGTQNVGLVLAENGLERTPRVGQAWINKCNEAIASTPEPITQSRKSTLLNGLTNSDEVFEKACLMDDNEWKVFSALQAFVDALRIPESIVLPYSTRVIGSPSEKGLGAAIGGAVTYPEPVSYSKYKAVMEGLKHSPSIDPQIFNKVNTAPSVKLDSAYSTSYQTPQFALNLPWGKIQMYSTILQEMIDFPVYPEQLDTERNATYTSMPDIIYQYEPWISYQSSGPRTQQISFHLHRDIWTGNHLDGRANKLIRFCEANTFAQYSGSAVNAPLIRLYIDGSLFISGVVINTVVNWSGPLGLDNWYLEFTLSLTIQEVSETPLNIEKVSKMKLIGG